MTEQTTTYAGTPETWLDGSTSAEFDLTGFSQVRTSVPCGDFRLPSDLGIAFLAAFDHDYVGVHWLAQVWDHTAPDDEQRWRCVLIRSTRDAGWDGRVVHEWREWDWHNGRYPFAEAGAFIEKWLTV